MKIRSLITVSLFLTVLLGASLACQHGAVLQGESENYRVGLQPQTGSISTGKLFGLTVHVCSEQGTPFDGPLEISAWMPSHNHGMNYRPVVTQLEAGIFNADGFQFHMPGRWQFVITVDETESIEIDSLVQ